MVDAVRAMGELYVGRSAFPILFQAVAAVEIPLEIRRRKKELSDEALKW